MKIKLINADLTKFINLLNGTSARGKNARAVSRFKKILNEKFDQYSNDEIELLKDYCVLDDNGDVLLENGSTFRFREEMAHDGAIALNELKNEEVVIDLTEFEPFILNLLDALENSEQQLYGEEMDALDELLTKIEEIKGDY